MEHFFPQIQVKTKKKSSSPKLEHFFPRILVETCAQMHSRVKILGECRCRPYSNYWGEYSQIIGEIYPLHPPRVSAPLHRGLALVGKATFFEKLVDDANIKNCT